MIAFDEHLAKGAQKLTRCKIPSKRMQTPSRIVFHLGAHKTGTTHLKDTLNARRAEISALGVGFLSNPETRAFLDQLFHPDKTLQHLILSGTPAHHTARNLASFLFWRKLSRLSSGEKTIVFSEENILGRCHDDMTSYLYPETRHLRLLNAFARKMPVSAVISIRPLDQFLPSAYAETLKWKRVDRSFFEARKLAWLEMAPSWAELIARIKGSLPLVDLHVWDYLKYRENWHDRHEALLGIEFPRAPDLGVPQSTATPSAKAIELAERCALPNGAHRAREIAKIYGDYPATAEDGKFSPLSEGEARILRGQYDRDVERVQRLPGVAFS